MVEGGNSPDVVAMLERWLALYALNGAVVDLTPRMEQWGRRVELTEAIKEFAVSSPAGLT